jgi:dihydropyrimidine dehydrogenase (NADP+)/dihydropyrimidine dehydrogenase (NAD+) subunit PreA
MKVGYRCVKAMCDELAAFMEKHRFQTLADFKGHSLQYFTTHHDLVQRQAAAYARSAAVKPDGQPVKSDQEWRGEEFVRQSEALARG